MTGPAWIVASALAVVLSGCAANDGREATATADCQGQIRVAGAIYTSYGYTDHQGTRQGTADAAECHDVGPDAVGSYFPDDPRTVTTWTFEGYPPEQVLGVRSRSNPPIAVYVADTVPSAERRRIFRALQPDDE